jgi:hypothetical protein
MDSNAIVFVGLCDEFCRAVENAREAEREDFIRQMLKLLPRLYISANDIPLSDTFEQEDFYINQALDEDYYDAVRRNVEELLGPDDVYLEVFEEDMKYSDTPVSASISEGLADMFQVFYNFINTIRDTTDETVNLALGSVAEDFRSYWSQTLCNTLRALNHLLTL